MTSVNDQGRGGDPIVPGSPLARALSGDVVPSLSSDFADRVMAAAEARTAPLPALRRRPGRWSGWKAGRRLAVGMTGVFVLASAAAATGLLQQFALPMPSAKAVWASIAGTAQAAPAAPPAPVATETPKTLAKVEIAGPVDTPEELGEAFRRVDEMHEGRRAERARIIDQRIASEIARRRAAGLKVPTPQEEARLRERIAAAEARRQQLADERIAARRAAMQRKVESGGTLTREDVTASLRPRQPLAQGSPDFERLRQMSPQERRAALQAMPPEERRALVKEYRARRSGAVPAPAPAPAPALTPSAISFQEGRSAEFPVASGSRPLSAGFRPRPDPL